MDGARNGPSEVWNFVHFGAAPKLSRPGWICTDKLSTVGRATHHSAPLKNNWIKRRPSLAECERVELLSGQRAACREQNRAGCEQARWYYPPVKYLWRRFEWIWALIKSIIGALLWPHERTQYPESENRTVLFIYYSCITRRKRDGFWLCKFSPARWFLILKTSI